MTEIKEKMTNSYEKLIFLTATLQFQFSAVAIIINKMIQKVKKKKGPRLPGNVCMSLLLQVEFAVERKQQRSCLQGKVSLFVIDVHRCQQLLRHCCTNTDIIYSTDNWSYF